ncbi:metallophosphoesterase [Alloacidobacterium dinghuense]|uniref:Metallophosphoesterase n=1 Tax=Alloacidobacterium dinghuense TaxID=2763107 RepID=A0A7G8BFT0_9BACT|nr:metallophosphoesterase [Alloacidobacterium dinghuense]
MLLSDTHELHRELDVPSGDILIHAGDFSMFSRSLRGIEDFNTWLGELPHRLTIAVPGNHEFFLASDPSRRSLLSNATVLINQSVEVDGLRIWGSPVTPLANAAFGVSSAEDRRGSTRRFRNTPTSLSRMDRRMASSTLLLVQVSISAAVSFSTR